MKNYASQHRAFFDHIPAACPPRRTGSHHTLRKGVPVERAALAAQVRAAIADVVKKQTAAGVDLVNDGELSKPSYATYVKDRLNGFGGTGNTFVYQDLAEFPTLEKRVFGDPGRSRRKTQDCNAPISVRDPAAARVDVENLKAAVNETKPAVLS